MSKRYKGIHIVGIKNVQKNLKENATMNDVMQIVKLNTSEATENMQKKAVLGGTGVFTGTKDGKKPTGATRRSIVAHYKKDGLEGHTGPKTEYAPYLVYGTRFMHKRDFFRPAFRLQRIKFKKDMERLVK